MFETHQTAQNFQSAAGKRDCRKFYNIYFFVSRPPRIKKWSYVEHALAYRISCGILTPNADDDGILLHR
jgi:hypothetical protein